MTRKDSGVRQDSVENLLLRSLPEEDFARLAPHLARVDFGMGSVLADIGKPIEWAHFPESGIVTFSEVLENGTRIGIAHAGYDGFAGWPILLDCRKSTHEARITSDGGSGLRISAADLVAACDAATSLRKHLLRFVHAITVQLGCTVISSLTQSAETRLCRWTLMAHDRVHGDQIFVTHEEIAVMLAVRRATITDVLHTLESEGFIRSERGKVMVLDRAGLRQRAGGTYGAYEALYSRLIAPFPRAE